MERLYRVGILSGILLMVCLSIWPAVPIRAAGHIYYVSSVSGNDSHTGLSPDQAFRTIGKINSLPLQPGDQVLFACGETWRAEMLRISASGTDQSPLTFGSYPATCANRPVLSGAQIVSGWTPAGTNLYVADLGAGQNAGKFPNGINQLFRDGVRLRLGRWPNLNEGDNGYATIDAQPASTQIVDAQLPVQDWRGAVLHIKGMRWYILNRRVTADNGSTLTLNSSADCWGGSCSGWGYFLNDHLQTLDQDGEWYYDPASQRLYLYALQTPLAHQMEASVVLHTDERAWGGILLGPDLGQPIAHVVIDNLEVSRWFRHGIASPTNLSPDENRALTIQNCIIRDVDAVGISLWTWIFNSTSPAPDGWRGGQAITITHNLIEGANHFGIDTPSRDTWIEANSIRNIGLISNVGASGLGCGFSGSNCTENGDGIRIYADQPDYSGRAFTIRYNRFEHIGYNGIDNFGYGSLIEANVFSDSCTTKGDCGAIRLFGGNSLADTAVHDIVIRRNIILDSTGNTDGARSDFKPLFGFGVYIDHYARNVTTEENTIVRSSSHGLLYQDSTGQAQGNILFDNVHGKSWGSQVVVSGAEAGLPAFTRNTLAALQDKARQLSLNHASQIGSADHNRYHHASRSDVFSVTDLGQTQTLAQWQAYSGQDEHSTQHTASSVAAYVLFYNDTLSDQTFPLLRPYRDLDGAVVTGSLTLPPFQARLLLPSGSAPYSLYLPLLKTP